MKSIYRKAKRNLHRIIYPDALPQNRMASERERLAKVPRYVEVETDLPGFLFKVPDAASFLASWEEIYDREIYRFIPSSESPRIIDCGANVGVSCLYFKENYPNARITAFEPDSKIFSYLRENLAGVKTADIELIEKGVWSSETVLRFQSEGADAGRIDETNETNTVKISTVRLRDYLNEPVDLLKMDIEGAETNVILDIAPALGNVRNLFVEYHSFVAQPQLLGILTSCLIEAGFRLQVLPMYSAAKPFLEIPSQLGMDLQLNIFCVRGDHSKSVG